MNAHYGLEYACNMFKDLVNKYHKFGYFIALDWEVMQYYHPRYDEKIEVVVPQCYAEFRH